MKSEITNVGHEVGYAVLVTITLVGLSILVFPLFIAFLPITVILGGLMIWHMDHIKKHNKGL